MYRLKKINTRVFLINNENVIIRCKNILEPLIEPLFLERLIELKADGTKIFNLDIDLKANLDNGTTIIPKIKFCPKSIKILLQS